MDSLCHPWFTTTNLSYRFPIFETSATALCGTTGRDLSKGNRDLTKEFCVLTINKWSSLQRWKFCELLTSVNVGQGASSPRAWSRWGHVSVSMWSLNRHESFAKWIAHASESSLSGSDSGSGSSMSATNLRPKLAMNLSRLTWSRGLTNNKTGFRAGIQRNFAADHLDSKHKQWWFKQHI